MSERKPHSGGNRGPRKSGGGFQKKSGGFKKGGGNFNRGRSGPRQLFPATCSECGQECKVPFKPTEGKPVFCRDCFQSKKESRD